MNLHFTRKTPLAISHQSATNLHEICQPESAWLLKIFKSKGWTVDNAFIMYMRTFYLRDAILGPSVCLSVHPSIRSREFCRNGYKMESGRFLTWELLSTHFDPSCTVTVGLIVNCNLGKFTPNSRLRHFVTIGRFRHAGFISDLFYSDVKIQMQIF